MEKIQRKQTLKLIEAMKSHNIDVYMITDSDWNLSEYTSAHFHGLQEFSGFTGGDGRLVVTSEGEAALWTDGRYFEQAEKELKGSGIKLMRLNVKGFPSWTDWIKEQLKTGKCFGVDGKTLSYREGKDFEHKFSGSRIKSMDLCDDIWPDRPKLKYEPCWILNEKYCGKSAKDKINELYETMKEKEAKWCITTAIDDVSWILNIRGNDIPNTPVIIAFLLIGPQGVSLYTDDGHFEKEGSKALNYLKNIPVTVLPYEKIYEDVKNITDNVIIDPKGCNFDLARLIPAHVKIIENISPVAEMKCMKNETEYENLKLAQHKDSTALTKFIYWFKENVSSGELTECSVAQKLHEFRSMQKNFLEDSFPAISAYGANASMAHYMPSRDKDVKIRPKGLYLVDSGGQYLEGTTDVTRTISCGEISQEEREGFTLVLMANLRLASMKFMDGSSGALLDGPAREVFWKKGLNYNHGTGHGVGFCLFVHEGPAVINYMSGATKDLYPVHEGMYISDEPGIYIPGKYGIRTENMLFVRHDFTNEYGKFLKLEVMTLCPIDKSCLDLSLMDKSDIALLNKYHEKVFNELKAEFEGKELDWLKEATSAINIE